MPLSPQCEAGCMSFDGGEVKHHRDCVHYPESLTKLWHDTEAAYQAEIERLRSALRSCLEVISGEGLRGDYSDEGALIKDKEK